MQELIGNILVSIGVGFALIGSIGVNRLPDFYTRAHAASKPDTLGLILCMVGLALHTGMNINAAKLILISVFVGLANPSAAHALGRSAVRAGLQPWTRKKGGKA